MAAAAGKRVFALCSTWAVLNQVSARRQFTAESGGSKVTDALDGMMASLGGDGKSVGSALAQVKAEITPEAASSIRSIITPAIEELVEQINTQVRATQTELDELVRNLNTETMESAQAKITADSTDTLWVQCVAEEKDALRQMEEAIALRAQTRTETDDMCAQRDVAAQIRLPPIPVRDVNCDLSVDSCPSAMTSEREYWSEKETMTRTLVAEKIDIWRGLADECDRLTTLGNEQENDIASKEHRFFIQQGTCMQLNPRRQVAQCLYGVKLLYKCVHFDDYDALVAKIEGTGTEHSNLDRVNELKTMLTAECLIDRHVLGEQDYVEGSLDSCRTRATENAEVIPVDTKASVVNSLDHIATCAMGAATFSGQSWNLPHHPNPKSSEYELIEDYSVAVNLHDPVNGLPQCAGHDWDYTKTEGQCGTAPECGTRNRLMIGLGGSNGANAQPSPFGGFGFFNPSDYDEVDFAHAEVFCGPKCWSNWQCAGFAWEDGKCFYKKNIECGTASSEGTCFAKRSSVGPVSR